MKKLFCSLLSFYCESNDMEIKFADHMARHNLQFATAEEYNFRLSLYSRTHNDIEEINSNPDNLFELAHNEFSTWTDEEFAAMLRTSVKDKEIVGASPEPVTAGKPPTADPLPEHVDWRNTTGMIQDVQKQGGCAAGWAFSAIAAIEALHF